MRGKKDDGQSVRRCRLYTQVATDFQPHLPDQWCTGERNDNRGAGRNPWIELWQVRVIHFPKEERKHSICRPAKRQEMPANCESQDKRNNLLEQDPSTSMTTMDNQVGGGIRRGGFNVLY
jgi:hypothetical protein